MTTSVQISIEDKHRCVACISYSQCRSNRIFLLFFLIWQFFLNSFLTFLKCLDIGWAECKYHSALTHTQITFTIITSTMLWACNLPCMLSRRALHQHIDKRHLSTHYSIRKCSEKGVNKRCTSEFWFIFMFLWLSLSLSSLKLYSGISSWTSRLLQFCSSVKGFLKASNSI